MSPFSSRLELRLGVFAGRRREPGTTPAATPVPARQPSGRPPSNMAYAAIRAKPAIPEPPSSVQLVVLRSGGAGAKDCARRRGVAVGGVGQTAE